MNPFQSRSTTFNAQVPELADDLPIDKEKAKDLSSDTMSVATAPLVQGILENVNAKELYSIPLIPLNVSFGIVTSGPTLCLKNMLNEELQKKGQEL